MFAVVARSCLRYRRWILAAWLLVFLTGMAAAVPLFMRLTDATGNASSESARGTAILTHATSMGPMAAVLVRGPPVAAASTRHAVRALTARLDRLPQVTGAVNACTSPDPHLRGAGGHASLIVVTVRKPADMMDQQMAVDAMCAALLPIVSALAASAGTLLVLLGVTCLTSVAPYALDVVMLLGLGLAVDYSLLMVNRFREARATGADVTGDVAHTAATAGRTVMFSGLTVATSLAGLPPGPAAT